MPVTDASGGIVHPTAVTSGHENPPVLPPDFCPALARDILHPPRWEELVAAFAGAHAAREIARRVLASRELLHFTSYYTRDYEIGWIHKEITDILMAFIQAVEEKRGPRLIIQLPPRHGKSQIASRCFPAFVLGKHPEWEFVTAGYNQDIANDFGRDVRAILNDPRYLDMFPSATICSDSNAVNFVKMEQNGSYRAVGVGGALTGMGAHILFVDDPVKNREDADSETIRDTTWKWYQSVARTRLAPGGGICIIQTRWHEDDLAGKLQQQAAANPEGSQWMVYSFPAIATEDEPHRQTGEALHPERWPLSELNKLRADMDPREWSALFQQNPTPAEGIAFKRDWLKYQRPPATPGVRSTLYIGTDFALGEKQSNDRSVLIPAVVDDHANIFFLPCIRDRLAPEELVETLLDLIAQHKPVQIAIENIHISRSIGPFLKRRCAERQLYPTWWEFSPVKDKLTRAAALRGRMQQGKIYFDPVLKQAIEEEMIPFPAGKHDDFVDACVTVCLLLDEMVVPAGPRKPPEAAAHPWSYEGMKLRERLASRRGSDDGRHIPRTLSGKTRETASGGKSAGTARGRRRGAI